MRLQSFMASAALALVAFACGAPATTPCPVAPPTPTCAAVAPPSSASATASASVATPVAPPRPSPPTVALAQALDSAMKAIEKNDYATADKHIATAAAAAGDDAHFAYLVARVRATRFVYAGDFEHAAAAYGEVIPLLTKHPELPDEFWSHNAMMMIRAAQGDPAAALAENDQATLSAARGTWDPEGREKLAFQKDRWHRAYLTRMLAESRTGSAKQALVRYAESALDDYRTRGFPESIAILDAYFAALDGKRDAALAAAKRVDPEKDDDVEDLYLVVVGLEAGGDHASAEAARRVMRRPGGVHIARAIMLRWLDIDAKPHPREFTPLHASAR